MTTTEAEEEGEGAAQCRDKGRGSLPGGTRRRKPLPLRRRSKERLQQRGDGGQREELANPRLLLLPRSRRVAPHLLPALRQAQTR